MMELAQMEAIAAELQGGFAELQASVADLGGRLGAIEQAGFPDTVAVPNTFNIGTGNMLWLGGWDGEAAYTPGNVVSFQGKTYVNIGEVKAMPAKLKQPPQVSDTLGLSTTEYFSEEIERVLLPSDPANPIRFAGQTIARVYQLRTPSGSKLTLPENKYSPFLILRYSVSNDKGEGPKNFASFAAQEVTGGTDATLQFLCVFATIEEHEAKPAAKPTSPVPFRLALTSSGGLTEEPHNKTPPADPEHWAELPTGVVPATPAASKAESGATKELTPSETHPTLVGLTFKLAAAAVACSYTIEVAGKVWGKVALAKAAEVQEETVSVPVGARAVLKITKVAGEAESIGVVIDNLG